MRKHAIAAIVASLLVSPAGAVEFNVVSERAFGDWRAVLYENVNGGRLFCALETVGAYPMFRINSYVASRDTFLEVFDPKWQLMPGQASFSVTFAVPDGPLTAELRGERLENAYVHDFTELQNYQVILGMLMSSTRIEVENSNGSVIANFEGSGSDAAVRSYIQCVDSGGGTR